LKDALGAIFFPLGWIFIDSPPLETVVVIKTTPGRAIVSGWAD
jgi:hypothetical protein